MTEMTRHMMTAMTMPTYSATSSVLGAAGGAQRPDQRFLHTTEVFPEEASDLIRV